MSTYEMIIDKKPAARGGREGRSTGSVDGRPG